MNGNELADVILADPDVTDEAYEAMCAAAGHPLTSDGACPCGVEQREEAPDE